MYKETADLDQSRLMRDLGDVFLWRTSCHYMKCDSNFLMNCTQSTSKMIEVDKSEETSSQTDGLLSFDDLQFPHSAVGNLSVCVLH